VVLTIPRNKFGGITESIGYVRLRFSRDSIFDDLLTSQCSLYATVNQLRQADGRYARTQRPATGGREVIEVEPPRHAAGALLIRLLLGPGDSIDAKTVDWMMNQPCSDALDKAFVARALRTYGTLSCPSRDLKMRYTSIVGGLAQDSTIWQCHNIAHVPSDSMYLWCVVWTVLPMLFDGVLGRELQADLCARIHAVIESHLQRMRPNQLLPSSFQSGQATGETVFGTCVALLAAELLAKKPGSRTCSSARQFVCELLDRIVKKRQALLSVPLSHPDGVATELYLSWASFLQVCAVQGLTLAREQFVGAHTLVKAWGDLPLGNSNVYLRVAETSIADLHMDAETLRTLVEVAACIPQVGVAT